MQLIALPFRKCAGQLVLHQSLISLNLEKLRVLHLLTFRSRGSNGETVDRRHLSFLEWHFGDWGIVFCSVRSLLPETTKAEALSTCVLLRKWELPGGGPPGSRFSCLPLPALFCCTSVGQVYFVCSTRTSVGFLCDKGP